MKQKMEVPTSASSDVTNGEPFLKRPDAAPRGDAFGGGGSSSNCPMPDAAPPKDSDAEFLLVVAKNHGTYEGMERLKAIATRLAAPPSDAAQPDGKSDAAFLCEVAKNSGTHSQANRLRALAARLYNAHPEDAGKLIEMGERIAELETRNAELERDLQHPEDAPEGPYHAKPSDVQGDSRWMVTYQDENVGCIYVTKGECEDIRDVLNRHELNRLKGDKADD